ncbi:CHL1 [Cordylochernes scorpioides]|uniref:CHL1 n=1 Tax=Cordylochernes scorpioides TaxID=51811 RepID=A0ABY6KEZ4_9ARAC|nr:CHL1 [Cordylochernes scorpioides]
MVWRCILLVSVWLWSPVHSQSAVTVPFPPTIIKQPPYEQLYQVAQTADEPDKPFTLECEAQGNPEPTYHWTKNGNQFDYVSYDKRITQQPRRGTLVFTKPDDVDEGLYQCFAENAHGTSVSNAVFLRKSELNSFPDAEAKDMTVQEGEPLTLDCTPPTGYPRPTIFWIIQSMSGPLRSINSSRITVDPEGNLHFSNVTQDDALYESTYACSATSLFRNEYKVGNRIFIRVEASGSSGQASYPPTRQYTSPPNMLALRGRPLEMSCIFGGTPLPDIEWSRKGGQLVSGRYTMVNYGKTLHIRNVDFEDEDTYECKASNGVGYPKTHAIKITVQSAPFWLASPNDTNAAEGEAVRFECKASGIPEPRLQWFVNGQPIEKVAPNPRRKVEGNILTLENLDKMDTAVYQCNASNVHGYAFKDFYVNVLALPPTITEQPEPVTKAVVTSTVTLRCRVFGAPRPEVKWMRDGQEMTGGRYHVLDSGDLRIEKVIVTDQGDYTCFASNKLGDAKAIGKLEVKGKTKITQPPESFEVAAGKSATFRCNAEADSSLDLTIEWHINGKPVDYDLDPRIRQAADNSLTISKTIELDSGLYICVAKTELDSEQANATLTVQGEECHLVECEEKTTLCVHADVPNAPRIVNINCDGQTALIEWQPTGDQRAPILSYNIEYNTSFTPDLWVPAFYNIPAPDTMFKALSRVTLTLVLQVSMSPWANYTFRVIARNKIGPSLPSSPSERCTTGIDVPYKNPEKVEGRGTHPDNLVISWTPMPLIEQNGPGFFYKVFWKREDIPNSHWVKPEAIITDWRQKNGYCRMVWRCILLVSVVLWSPVHSQSAVTVPFPPTIIKQPPYEQLYQVAQTADEPDKPFTLECEAQGNPEPTYHWTKNGNQFDYVSYDKRITQQPRRGTLVFTKPDDVDEGLYQCFAENAHGTSVSNAVFLRKSDCVCPELNSFPDAEAKDMTVQEGEPLTLDCTPPTGYPRPTIFWIIQSMSGPLRSINSSRITVDPEGNLHFSNVTQDDALYESTYACSATSLFRNEYKVGNRIFIRVEASGSSGQASYPPTRQYTSPPNMLALRGRPLEMSCIFGGTPLPDIEWSRKGGQLVSGRYTMVNYGKTLHIRNVDFEDEDTYECKASNGVGYPKTHAIKITVQSAPFWLASPNDTNAAEGEAVRFECKASGIPEPRLQWFVNGQPIEKVAPNPRRKVEGNILTLENLDKMDTAVYQCNASNVHGYAFKDFYVNVLALPPTITEQPEPVTKAVVTSTVTLRCRVFGAPRPEVKWMRDGQEMTGGRYHVLDSGDLRIEKVIVTDQGDYTCFASNKLGDAKAIGKLEVKGKTKITQPPESFEVAAGKSATFRCNAEADSSLDLTIEWHFNGKPVDYDLDPRIRQAADNSLTISKTIELDSGLYICVAKTELDSEQANATLTVQDVPNAPRIVNINCDGQTALIEWQPTGDQRAPILSYNIEYNTSFTPDLWVPAFYNIPAPDTMFKVSMSPWANYTFRVIARNKIGPSLPSSPSERCTTGIDVPYKNPEKVEGRGTHPDNLVISWTPMPLIEQNGPGFFYKVFWKREDIPNSHWVKPEAIITDWRQNELVIDNQPTFKPYRIKVEAHNRKGQANVQATEVVGHSGEDQPSEAPRNFMRLEIVDASSARFSWDPVPPDSLNGHFKGYKILTWTIDEEMKDARRMVVSPNVTTALVKHLKPNSNNIVVVMAFNENYDGPASDKLDVRTPEGKPGPVASFDAYPLGSVALYLIWKRPVEPNGNLTGYNIYYEEVDGTEIGDKMERHPPINDPRETRAKLAGLKPNTKYRVTVAARTRAGEGAPNFIEVTTNREALRPPDVPNFIWSHLPEEGGKAGVKVTWVPAVNGHPGSHFYVQYRRKGEDHWEPMKMEENQDSVIVSGLELNTLYEMRVVAVDGRFERPSRISEIETGNLVAMSASKGTDGFISELWFILTMCTIALLLVLLIVVCLVKRNRGGKYTVHDKEATQGRDLDDSAGAGGFSEYSKPQHRASHTSLNSSLKGESDTDSMADYGEGETGPYGEDGSFIGQYHPEQKATTSPSAMATFV